VRLVPTRSTEAIAPARLGPGFRWFWFAFAGSALLVGVLWREFEHIVHASET
jgi:hypothetical protein